MIIKPDLFLAQHCPFCQERILFRTISTFLLNRHNIIKILCSCGSITLSLKNGGKHLYFSAFCPVCMEEHNYIFPLDTAKKHSITLTCQESGINLAYFGQKKRVIEQLNEEDQVMLSHKEELKELFCNADVMARLLYHLNKLIRENQVSCPCGSENFDLRIRANKLVLCCAHCQSSVYILASRPADLRLFQQIAHISLDPQGPTINYQPNTRNFK